MKIISLADFKNLLDNKFYLPFITNDVFQTYHLQGDVFIWQKHDLKKQYKATIKNRNWDSDNLTIIETKWKNKKLDYPIGDYLYFCITVQSPEQLATMINRLSKMKAFL